MGLSAGALTVSNTAYDHSFPFSPSPGDYAGTDQIYVGSDQSGFHDGYSQYSGRIAGPQIVTMNYSSLIAPGQTLTGLTIGLVADDFQYQAFGNPFTATINGATNTVITNQLNAFNQTGPYEQFFSVGIDPTALLPSNTLTLTINEGGDGGDGCALDFVTIGVTTQAASSAAAPEPNSATLAMLGSGALGGALAVVRRRRAVQLKPLPSSQPPVGARATANNSRQLTRKVRRT